MCLHWPPSAPLSSCLRKLKAAKRIHYLFLLTSEDRIPIPLSLWDHRSLILIRVQVNLLPWCHLNSPLSIIPLVAFSLLKYPVTSARIQIEFSLYGLSSVEIIEQNQPLVPPSSLSDTSHIPHIWSLVAFIYHLWPLISPPTHSSILANRVLPPPNPHWPPRGLLPSHHPGLWQLFFLKLPKRPGHYHQAGSSPSLMNLAFLQATFNVGAPWGLSLVVSHTLCTTPLLMASTSTIYCPKVTIFWVSGHLLSNSACVKPNIPPHLPPPLIFLFSVKAIPFA